MKNLESRVDNPFSSLGKRIATYALVGSLVGCAGIQRSCSSCAAENFASDWIVVQYDLKGKPINCWKLPNTSITNEQGSDGIYWLDSNTDNLVHISGWYNRVQVSRGQYDDAAKSLGIELSRCEDGKYLPETKGPEAKE